MKSPSIRRLLFSTLGVTTVLFTLTGLAAQSCDVDQFMCDNECIPLSWRCDGTNDCRDGTDELNCRLCRSDHYQCDNSQCIVGYLVCNGMDNCGDNSDERYCHSCADDEFPCTGECLELYKRCDGYKDCKDGSDEEGCTYTQVMSCAPGLFSCGEVPFCIPAVWQCDGERDCSNGRDEMDCDGGPVFPSTTTQGTTTLPGCTTDQFQCENGQCIPMSYKCDKYKDCSDESDENNEDCGAPLVPTTTMQTTTIPAGCTSSQFQCDNGQCILLSYKCDNYNDCDDQSDEKNEDCGGPSVPTTTQTTTSTPGCTSSQFQCDNGQCIPLSYKCDNYNDCDDQSDENNEDCVSPTSPSPPTSQPTSPPTTIDSSTSRPEEITDEQTNLRTLLCGFDPDTDCDFLPQDTSEGGVAHSIIQDMNTITGQMESVFSMKFMKEAFGMEERLLTMPLKAVTMVSCLRFSWKILSSSSHQMDIYLHDITNNPAYRHRLITIASDETDMSANRWRDTQFTVHHRYFQPGITKYQVEFEFVAAGPTEFMLDNVDIFGYPCPLITCKDGEYLCWRIQECLPESVQCNGVYDCLDRTDEGEQCDFSQGAQRTMICSYEWDTDRMCYRATQDGWSLKKGASDPMILSDHSLRNEEGLYLYVDVPYGVKVAWFNMEMPASVDRACVTFYYQADTEVVLTVRLGGRNSDGTMKDFVDQILPPASKWQHKQMNCNGHLTWMHFIAIGGSAALDDIAVYIGECREGNMESGKEVIDNEGDEGNNVAANQYGFECTFDTWCEFTLLDTYNVTHSLRNGALSVIFGGTLFGTKTVLTSPRVLDRETSSCAIFTWSMSALSAHLVDIYVLGYNLDQDQPILRTLAATWTGSPNQAAWRTDQFTIPDLAGSQYYKIQFEIFSAGKNEFQLGNAYLTNDPCPQTECPAGFFRCHDGLSCIPSSRICDGRFHCQDRSDEGNDCEDRVLYCSFEELNSECLQGAQQDWRLTWGQRQPLVLVDNTRRHRLGKYIFAVQGNEEARVSFTVPAGGMDKLCVNFYYMASESTQLQVKAYNQDMQYVNTSMDLDSSPVWTFGQLEVPRQVQAVVFSAQGGNAALDDVSIFSKPCS